MKSHLPVVHDSLVAVQKLVYAPHVYPAFVDIGGDFKPKHKKSLAKLFKTRIKETTRNKAPMLIGELGLSPQKKDFDTYLRLFNQLADSCQASWAYWSNDHGGWSPLKADGAPTLILPELLRVYPQATAGKLLHYAYKPVEKYFEMEFISNASIKAPTIIAIPRGIYATNYKLIISGTTDYKTEVDPVTNSIMLYVGKGNIDVQVTIQPSSNL